jgi:hypothetical protein
VHSALGVLNAYQVNSCALLSSTVTAMTETASFSGTAGGMQAAVFCKQRVLQHVLTWVLICFTV